MPTRASSTVSPSRVRIEPEHAVRGRVLRAHVDDEAVVLGLLGALDDVVPVLPGDVEDRALGAPLCVP